MASGRQKKRYTYDSSGAIIRGDVSDKKMHLIFSGDEYGDGAETILNVLNKHGIKASFFLTGNFYRNAQFAPYIQQAKQQGHYLGAHSDQHLLYNDWTPEKKRLVSQAKFKADLKANYAEMEKYGITAEEAPYFLPPYEWNDAVITQWADQMGITMINYSPGTLSHADYTTPDVRQYKSTDVIMESIMSREEKGGLHGFMLLSHIGTHPDRTDKFYTKLDELISALKEKGYSFVSLQEVLDLAQ